jgi:hypothetical protein
MENWKPCRYRVRSREKIDVLKNQRSTNGVTMVPLSGQLEKEHIVELGKLFEAQLLGGRMALDLKHLTLAGQSEVDFFAECEDGGMTLVNRPPYIRERVPNQRNERQTNDF